MIRQKVYISTADWDVDIYYDATPDNRDEILDCIVDMGVDRRTEVRAYRQLSKWEPNLGLTYSSIDKHKSIVVIGFADSIAQFLNTLAHEKQHLEMTIIKSLGIDPYGEEAAYISGDIIESIYNNGKEKIEYLIHKLISLI